MHFGVALCFPFDLRGESLKKRFLSLCSGKQVEPVTVATLNRQDDVQKAETETRRCYSVLCQDQTVLRSFFLGGTGIIE